jgi:predicted DNA-binding transcriptional regulator AlpA
MNGEPRPRPATPMPRRAEPDRLLTIKEVSAILGDFPIQSIYKKRNMGTFCPGYKIGKHLRWKYSELMAWIEEQRDPI